MSQWLKSVVPPFMRLPPLSAQDLKQREEHKALKAQLRAIDSRLDSVQILARNSKLDDARRLLQPALGELVQLVAHLNGLPPGPPGESLEAGLERLPDDDTADDLRIAIRALHTDGQSAAAHEAVTRGVDHAEVARRSAKAQLRQTVRKSRSPALVAYRHRMWQLGAAISALVIVIALAIGIRGYRAWTAKERARELAIASTRQSLDTLASLLWQVKQETHKPLNALTGSNCTNCVCRTGNVITDTPACPKQEIKTLRSLLAHLGKAGDSVRLTDAWGRPFTLDENEQEGSPHNCSQDLLSSAGPDGILLDKDDLLAPIPNILCHQ